MRSIIRQQIPKLARSNPDWSRRLTWCPPEKRPPTKAAPYDVEAWPTLSHSAGPKQLSFLLDRPMPIVGHRVKKPWLERYRHGPAEPSAPATRTPLATHRSGKGQPLPRPR